jgi:cell division septation protein DedD
MYVPRMYLDPTGTIWARTNRRRPFDKPTGIREKWPLTGQLEDFRREKMALPFSPSPNEPRRTIEILPIPSNDIGRWTVVPPSPASVPHRTAPAGEEGPEGQLGR